MRFMSLWRPAKTANLHSEKMFRDMNKLVEEMTKDGTLVQTGGWDPSSPAIVVRNDGNAVHVTDGPYTEAKELIAGYAILEATSREHAIELAKRYMKIAGEGTTEMRELGGPPPTK